MRIKTWYKLLSCVLALALLAGCGSNTVPTSLSVLEETKTAKEPVGNGTTEDTVVSIETREQEETEDSLATQSQAEDDALQQAEKVRLKEEEDARLRAEEEARQKAEEDARQAEEKALTQKQRNSINMLNYLTVLVQEINNSPNSRLFLEAAYSELINNTEPSIVDDLTLDEYEKILNVIEKYRMIAVKRERLQYLYDQNSAEAIRKAMPNPLAILNFVQSGNPLKALVSVAYLALDSTTSYSEYTNELNMQYLQSGWALDDEQAADLHDNRSSMFAYMVRVSRDLPEGLTLNEDSVSDFVKWTNETNVTSRIRWFESNRNTYENYGEYWLVLAKSYYEKAETGDSSYYKKCLDAVRSYGELDNSIFRKDIRLAQTLPYAISAARECLTESEYELVVASFAQQILENTYNSDWSLRFFAAQTYLDLYSRTQNNSYLSIAYEIAYDNVNELVAEQCGQNNTFLADIVEQPTKGLDKETKKQVESYNDLLSKTRKTELCPVYEPLRLNCELLFGISEKMNISASQRADIDSILHYNGEPLFLNPVLDNQYRFTNRTEITETTIPVSFDKGRFEIPAMFITDFAKICVTVNDGTSSVTISDWVLSEVERNKSNDVSDFVAVFESQEGKKADYPNDAMITVSVSYEMDGTNALGTLDFAFKTVVKSYVWVVHSASFERII